MESRAYRDLLFKYNVENFVSKKTGWDPEKTFLELNTPKPGKKSKSIEKDFDFSSLTALNGGRPDRIDVAKFMSKNTGKGVENCFIELSMPKLARHSSGYSRGALLEARGFGSFI